MKIYLDNNLGVSNVEQEELTQDTIGYNILKVYIPNAVLTPYDTFTCYYGALLQNGRKVGWFAMEARTSTDADYEANYTLYKATLEQCVVSVEGKVYIGCQVLLGNSGNATLIKKNTAVVQFNVRKSVAINNDILVLDTDQTTTDVLESYKNLLENALTTYATKAEVYTKTQIDSALALKADKSDTYTKTEADNKFAPKTTAITHSGNQLQDYSGNNIYPNVAFNSVDINKLTDDIANNFESVNLFDSSKIVSGGYYASDGTIISNENSQYSTQYIKVKYGVSYKFAYFGEMTSIATYNENGEFVGRINHSNSDTVTFGSNVKYIRLSYYNFPFPDEYMFCEVTKYPEEYEPYALNVQVSDYSITPIKTSFFDINKSRNLFNVDAITSGKTFNNTEIVDNTNRYISDYISVDIGKTIYFSYRDNRQPLAVYKVVAYDLHKQPLSASNSWVNSYTIPNGCYYIRFSAENSSLTGNVQAEYDSITSFVPYYDYKIIKEINLPKELYTSRIEIIKNNDDYDITMGKYTFRFYKAYSTTTNLDSYDINNIYMGNTQIEFGNILGAIKETGQDDFMGGVAHGDEQIISMNIYCDGIPVSQSTSGYKVDIFLLSNFKRVSDHTTNVAKRIVHIIFQNNTMTIKTNFEVLVDNFNVDFVYVGMWGQVLSQTTKLFTNMNEYDLSNPSNYNSTKVFNSSYVNPKGIVDISIVKGFDYPNYRFAFVYYSDSQRVKNYFTLAQNETFNTNDVLYGITEYKFN